MVKIFQLNEHDWVAAETMEEAIKCLLDITGESEEDIIYLDVAHELDFDSMTHMKAIDEDDVGKKPPESFLSILEFKIKCGEKFPQYFFGNE